MIGAVETTIAAYFIISDNLLSSLAISPVADPSNDSLEIRILRNTN